MPPTESRIQYRNSIDLVVYLCRPTAKVSCFFFAFLSKLNLYASLSKNVKRVVNLRLHNDSMAVCCIWHKHTSVCIL